MPSPHSLVDWIEPMPGNIVVRVKDFVTQSSSGLHLEPTMKSQSAEKPTKGIVVAVNADDDIVIESKEGDTHEYKSPFTIGETVIFGKYSGTDLKRGRERYVILKEEHVLARLIKSAADEDVTVEK